MQDNKVIESNIDSLTKAGFEIDRIGNLTVMVREIPSVIVATGKVSTRRPRPSFWSIIKGKLNSFWGGWFSKNRKG